MGKKIPTVEPKALENLTEYDWPGNVRELKNLSSKTFVK